MSEDVTGEVKEGVDSCSLALLLRCLTVMIGCFEREPFELCSLLLDS